MQSSPVRERRNHDSTTPISPARTSSKKEDKKHFNSFHSSSWKLLLQRFLLRLRSNSIQKLTLKVLVVFIIFYYSFHPYPDSLPNIDAHGHIHYHDADNSNENKISLLQFRRKQTHISNLADLGYESRPLAFAYHIDENKITKAMRLNPHAILYPSKREIFVEEEALAAQELLLNDKHYNHGMRDVFETEQCSAQYEWQLTSFPTCNQIHESNMFDLYDESVRLVNNGYWRDVWTFREVDQSMKVIKTMRYEHDFEDRNYDRHRRDAVAMEHLTASENVVNIYSFCGNSGVFEFSGGGDIDHVIWPRSGKGSKLSYLDRLKVALHVAMGIADMHNIDKEGQASIAHTDITPGQFIMIDGLFKLNDFNRCRFIRWNSQKNEPCGYRVGSNPGKFRSPEEYMHNSQSEMVDIYSMGNIFYSLLTELWPFEELEDKEAKKKIKAGDRPPIPDELRHSDDPSVKTLRNAIDLCWIHSPRKRATAREVENYIAEELEKILKKENKPEGKKDEHHHYHNHHLD